MKKIFIFFFLQFYVFCCLGDSLVFFSPSLECKNHILKLINNSKDSIDIAIYSFTDQDIADALETAHNKGIKIRIISDRQQTMNKNSQIYSLYASGIPVKINTINKLEHNKFIIVDKYIFYFTVSNIRKFRLDFLGKYLDLFLKKS